MCEQKPNTVLMFFVPALKIYGTCEHSLKVMLHGTIIRNNDFSRNTALQHCCDIVSNGCHIVATLQPFVALKIVVPNRLV